jgi:hypothetical protein
MNRLVVVAAVFLLVGFLAGRVWHQAPVSAQGQGGGTPSGNGDVNGDGSLNITDPIYLLQHLFQGGPAPVPIVPKAAVLPATGQTKCYDDKGNEISCDSAEFPGQDGFYQAGYPLPPMADCFVDNGDGTVTDKCTGLMWQKGTPDLNGDGQFGNPDCVTWQAALKYCEDMELAGHTDWRLPNLQEFESIIRWTFDDASLAVFDSVFEFARSDWTWSSTTLPWKLNDTYLARPGGVMAHENGKDCGHFILAVRGGL